MGTWVFAMIGTLLIIDTVRTRDLVVDSNFNAECECGVSGEGISNRIVGGYISNPHVFPWIVAIFNKKSLHCGGSLINDRFVLTAGHCVKWTHKKDLTLGVGYHDIKNPNEGYEVPIEDVILHEDFESDYLHDTNDIALIKLRFPVPYNENIRPICLPRKGVEYTGRDVKVTGWGRVVNNGGASRFLRQATLKAMSLESCRNTSYGDHITSSMTCAYSEGTDACQGDSGGPLLMKRYNGKYEIIGIVSWGIGCAQKGIPGVYVKLVDYLPWIYRKTRGALYCQGNN